MCDFFSLLSNGYGKIYYFNHKIRKQILSSKLNYELDSHASIAYFFKLDEDKMNKWEYNPLFKKLIIDQINANIYPGIRTYNATKEYTDYNEVFGKCISLDFKTIVPELIIKPIIHPFNDIQNGTVLPKDIELLKKWRSVGRSVRRSVWDSVRHSVGGSVGNSVWDSVWDLAGYSVWDSVWDSVRDSVWDSVRAYISSFFSIPKWKYIDHEPGINPFQSCIDLWKNGLVPSFDGKKWRLHGTQGKILWEGIL
ncbi:MAG: hypothetical protein ACFE9S_07515 [Candidatus Hermodarchaeota archaeon]